MTARYSAMMAKYGPEKFQKIFSSKVLVVGAGGIGCEILKNLALSGFFLFRQEHVGMSKAVVAAQAVVHFNPDVRIIPHHGNIKNKEFNIPYFSQFTLVLNALDNIEARKHVNRLCLAARVPLFDAGTTGYLGQVMPIFKGVTECYECTSKPTPKTYAICTIRSTPDKPVHCIVWAKELFKLMYGVKEDSMLHEDPLSGDTSVYMHLFQENYFSTTFTASNPTFAAVLKRGEQVLRALFVNEVTKRIDMGTYQTATTAPKPLDTAVISSAVAKASAHLMGASARPSQLSGWERQITSAVDNCTEFLLCMVDLVKEYVSTASSAAGAVDSLPLLSFDKDSDAVMKLVGVAGALRCAVFGIGPVCHHEAKGIAGNIIPAIATTNAIVAALQVQQAIKYVVSVEPSQPISELQLQHFPYVFCLRSCTRKGYYLQPTRPDKPSPNCFVCSTAELTLTIDTRLSLLGDLVRHVLKGRVGFNTPNISLGASTLYEEGEGADESLSSNLTLPLCACPGGGIVDGSQVTVDDFSQDLKVKFIVCHRDNSSFLADPVETVVADLFTLSGPVPLPSAVESSVSSSSAVDVPTPGVAEEVDEVFVISDTAAPTSSTSVREAPSRGAPPILTNTESVRFAKASGAKRGRPPSKVNSPENGADEAKKKIKPAAASSALSGGGPVKRRGRPKSTGAITKVNSTVATTAAAAGSAPRRGRPLGSLNRKKDQPAVIPEIAVIASSTPLATFSKKPHRAARTL